ncbi:hypothetical protein C789_2055 [Microcystis aeruginosa FACHB-905 = DIANCHI905]|uniref:Uncharacterized protein n=1 Tax=Microcystis aeruginosa PCC 7806SL TaxID=1903187 RepID=A0AB33BLG2_MICA7|nr:hypothetical protein BH695_2083 [Microcystis aeruginosa PCC 7806SL]ELS48132.1 hypothetical protein C789_2055 [Microcystis aeruginosa FACHB-905 = DIANCHI905]
MLLDFFRAVIDRRENAKLGKDSEPNLHEHPNQAAFSRN